MFLACIQKLQLDFSDNNSVVSENPTHCRGAHKLWKWNLAKCDGVTLSHFVQASHRLFLKKSIMKGCFS